MIAGAAIGGAVPNVPSWDAGYNSYSVGGVIGAMLQPSGGFGKFCLVLLALSMLGNMTGSSSQAPSTSRILSTTMAKANA